MKSKVSISINKGLIKKVEEIIVILLKRDLDNRSHVFEYALIKFLEGEKIK